MNKRLLFWIKLLVLLAVLALVAHELAKAWANVPQKMPIDWRWGGIAVAAFCLNMLNAALVWRFLASRMGDHSPTVRLLAAYTFSQLGKYIPGKVALLFLRIERAARFGMSAGICTLSTLLENALYIISGGLVGMLAVVRVLEELRNRGVITQRQQQWQWPLILLAIALLTVACYPRFFYGAVNRLLRRMKKPTVPPKRQLGMTTLALAIIAFVPCWICGGIALWASTQCVHPVDFAASIWFTGAFALSVILGMVSLLPGGLGVRELVLAVAVTLQLSPLVGHDQALILGSVAAILQRLFQVIAELLLGLTGMAATSGQKIENAK